MLIHGYAQERVTTFGLQVKPIIPSTLLRTGATSLNQNNADYVVDHLPGYSFGGVIRIGLNNRFSVESGISYVRRNFESSVQHYDQLFSDTVGYRIIGYEIPVTGLVFVRLSDQIYMNTAFGLAFDMFPSDVSNFNSAEFVALGTRTGIEGSNIFPWLKVGLTANVGFEYRTKEKGYFYLGASYHRPFGAIYDVVHIYDRPGAFDKATLQLSGNYLTVDFKYFFHEEPKEKKVKRDPDTMPSWMKAGN